MEKHHYGVPIRRSQQGFGEQDVMETKILDRNINREIVRELARLGVRGACGEDENLSLYKLHDTSFIVKSFRQIFGVCIKGPCETF